MKKVVTLDDSSQRLVWAGELRTIAARSRLLATQLGKGRNWDVAMDIAADLCELANMMQPTTPVTKPKPVSHMRQVTVERIINGKRVRVQSPRMPFAIAVEGRQ